MSFITPYIVTVIWFMAVLAIAYYADRVWSRLLGGAYWVFLAPGVAVHELSHAAGCLLMFAKITKIKLFGREGGEVQHGPPRVPIVGQAIISLAPVAGCAVVLVLVGYLLNAPMYRSIGAIPMKFDLSAQGVGSFVGKSVQAIWAGSRGIVYSNWLSWKTYVFVYAAICLGISLRPSTRDLRNSFVGLAAIGAVIAILDAIFRALGQPTAIQNYVLKPIQHPLHFLVSFLTVVLVITLLAWLIRLLIHHLTGPRRAGASPPREKSK